jgi:hypothetical protein
MTDITGLREDKRPQSSRIVHALLDRLEAAEHELEIALREFAWSNDSESQADCARSVLEESK